jgi:hypothetical protein
VDEAMDAIGKQWAHVLIGDHPEWAESWSKDPRATAAALRAGAAERGQVAS